jgi:hypothetical protein
VSQKALHVMSDGLDDDRIVITIRIVAIIVIHKF